MRVLFSSIHCYLDPASGAALCTRELLEPLAARGMDCRMLTTGTLDPERETALDEVLATLELPARRFQAELRTGGAAEVIDLVGVNGVRVTLMPTVSTGQNGIPVLASDCGALPETLGNAGFMFTIPERLGTVRWNFPWPARSPRG